MKSKRIGFILLIMSLFMIIVGFILAYNLTHYIIFIRNPDNIFRITYTSPNGDVYELTDKNIIEQYVNELNGMAFKKKHINTVSFYSSSNIEFYSKDGESVYLLNLKSDTCILLNSLEYEYISNQAINTDIFYECGKYIKNIHY